MKNVKVTNQALQRVGLKVTLPRCKILQVLDNAKKNHMSAEAIYKKLLATGEEIGLATVYRVLAQFEVTGIVRRHYFETGYAVFERAQKEHHDHLVCINCGNVKEFVDPVIEKRQHVIAKRQEFTITHHSLQLYGECYACKKRSKQ